MKKIAILAISLMAITHIATSQNCTNCDANNTITPENHSSARGKENSSTGQASFASGRLNTASNMYSTALGYHNIASGQLSFAAGGYVSATGVYSIGLGDYLEASGSNSMVIGTGAGTTNPLINSSSNSLMIGFGSNKPTLFVSTASASDKTGTIGIGDVTSPAAKLHIKTDYGEESIMFIEPWTWNSNQWSELRIGTVGHAVRASANYGMEFKTESNYIFNSQNANMGIGVLTPTEKLEVNGNIKQPTGYSVLTDKVHASGTSGLKLYNNSGDGIFVSPGGNVGIGTQLALNKLEVVGTVKATDFIGDGSGLTNVPGSGYWVLNGNDMYCSNSGKIGIGIQIPTAKLEVAGTVKATSFTGNGTALTGVKDYRWQDSYYGSITTNGKVIIGKENYIGTEFTEISDPQLDVRSDDEVNHKLANFIDSDGRRVFIVTKLSESGYSSLPVPDDAGIFWSDGKATGTNQNENAGFVIAAHRDGQMAGKRIDKDGNVGIGKEIPLAKLDVDGDIKANTVITNTLNVSEFEISILTVTDKLWAGEIEVTNLKEWKDCVFEENYNLMPLSETEAFIRQNKHLPGIPSEAEVLENGINVGEMNALLLQKIEELTLYVIELEKKIKEIK